MQIIRKRLQDNASLTGQRYSSGDDVFQVWDGSQWVDAPEIDPRHQNMLPPPATADPRCDAAFRMVAQIEQFVTIAENGLAGGATASLLANALAAGFAIFGGVIALLWFFLSALATVFVVAGFNDLQDNFTSGVYDNLRQYFYCALQEDGTLSVNGLQQILADVAANESVTVNNVFGAIVNFLGEGGFNAAASSRSETGDCSGLDACEWTFHLKPGIGFDDFWYYHELPTKQCNETTGIVNGGVVYGTLDDVYGSGGWLPTPRSPSNFRTINLAGRFYVPPGSTVTHAAVTFTQRSGGNLDGCVMKIRGNNAVNCRTTFGFPGIAPTWTDQWVDWIVEFSASNTTQYWTIDSIDFVGTGVNFFLA